MMKSPLSVRLLLLGSLLLCGCLSRLQAEDYQWSLSIDQVIVPHTENEHPRAFLWIPPNCQRVRAIIFAQNNMEEPTILANPVFRKTLSELGFAEIFVAPHLGSIHFRFDTGEDKILDQLLKDFAKQSGYQEIQYAPLVPMGHSAMAELPTDMALWDPGRVLAALSISGMWPYFTGDRNPQNPMGGLDWGDRNLDGVPVLVTKGEYELGEKTLWDGWYGGTRGDYATKHPNTVLTQIVEPGYGHFEVSDAKVAFLCLYLREVARYRLPANAPLDGPVHLVPITPRQGWLYDGWRRDEEPRAPAAPYASYRGNKAETFFAFDEQMARAIEKFQAHYPGKEPVVLSYLTRQGVAPHIGDHVDCHLPFVPEADGITFKVAGVFADKFPWKKSGSILGRAYQPDAPLAHPIGENEKIQVHRICGEIKQVQEFTFQIALDRTDARLEASRPPVGSFWLYYAGDGRYRRAVQQGEMKLWLNTHGQDQQIEFPPIPDQKASASMPPITLHAHSSAGLPVRYFVREGPAEVDDTGQLTFTRIPPRSHYPIKVTVVAWQWGRSTQPQVKTAPLAEQSFLIEGPESR